MKPESLKFYQCEIQEERREKQRLGTDLYQNIKTEDRRNLVEYKFLLVKDGKRFVMPDNPKDPFHPGDDWH
jgi:hypothetical protein